MPEFNIETIPPNLFAEPDLTSQLPRPPPQDVFLQPYWSPHIAHELISTANALVAPRGKGIYATDESPDVIQALLDGVSLNDHEERAWSEEENRERRKKWRECAYNAVPSGIYPLFWTIRVPVAHFALQKNTSLVSYSTRRP